MCFVIWDFFIVFCKIVSCLMPRCSFLEILNQNSNLKFHQMDFWFEFLDINLNEKTTICHDCHGFKWWNINNCPILILFFLRDTLLARWIVTAPKRHKGFKNFEIEGVPLIWYDGYCKKIKWKSQKLFEHHPS
jgi:hypothetical protein